MLSAVKEKKKLSVSLQFQLSVTQEPIKWDMCHSESNCSGQSSNFKWQMNTNDSNDMAISADLQINKSVSHLLEFFE